MNPVARALIWMLVSTTTLAVPLLMVALNLPRKSSFELRLTGGIALLAAFQLLYVPEGPFSSMESISTAFLVQGVFFFAANFLIMALIVKLCFRCDLATAAFCAVVGYTAQNLAATIGSIAGILLPAPADETAAYLFMSGRMLLSALVVYAIFYRSFVRRIQRNGMSISSSKVAYLFIIAVVLFDIIFDIASKRFLSLGMPLGYVILSRLAVAAMCLYTLMLEYELLYSRHMKAEMAATQRLLEDRRAQYELSRETIDAINLKCHDIRHQIRHLGDGASGSRAVDQVVLDDIAREVNVYDSTVQTGNEALDTILTERMLLGEREGISHSCIIDGAALGFMSPTDIYSLFGNALENAYEAVRQIDDPGRRNISVLVRRVANMVSVHIENYHAGKVRIENGMPQTSKADAASHGFGTKSMKMIVEKYGGTMTIDADDELFRLDMLIPIATGQCRA